MHQRVANYLHQANPGGRGFSLRAVEQFCSERRISKLTPIADGQLDRVVATSISKVGPTYGQKIMNGMLALHGIHVAEKQVASSMQRVNEPWSSPGPVHCHRESNEPSTIPC